VSLVIPTPTPEWPRRQAWGCGSAKLLPAKLQTSASLLNTQPSEVQEAFQFPLATAMHEAGKFEQLNMFEVDGQWHCTFNGVGEGGGLS